MRQVQRVASGDPEAERLLAIELIRTSDGRGALQLLGHKGGMALMGERWGQFLIQSGAYVEPPAAPGGTPDLRAISDARRYDGSVVLASDLVVGGYDSFHRPTPFTFRVSYWADIERWADNNWVDPYWDLYLVDPSGWAPDSTFWTHGPSYSLAGEHSTNALWVRRDLATTD
jgi:hypothetical protein